MTEPVGTEPTPPNPLGLLERIEKLLNTRAGNVLLILMWPAIVAGLGLPTGMAQAALEMYLGRPLEEACPVCECGEKP